MFVRDFVVLGSRFEPAAGALVRAADTIVGAAAAAVVPDGRVEIGAVRSRYDSFVLPIRWDAGNSAAFSWLDGDLELAPGEDDVAHLSVSGSCAPPWSANDLNQAAGQRRVDACLRGFLEQLQGRLSQGDDRA